jgi:hypothetical protein
LMKSHEMANMLRIETPHPIQFQSCWFIALSVSLHNPSAVNEDIPTK